MSNTKAKIAWLILSCLMIGIISAAQLNAQTNTCPPYAARLHLATSTVNASAALCAPDNAFASVGLGPNGVLILDMGENNEIIDGPGVDFYYYERSSATGILMDRVLVAVTQDDGQGNPGTFAEIFNWGDGNPDNNGTIPPDYLPEIPNRLIRRSDLHNDTGIGIDIGNDDSEAYRFVRFQSFPLFVFPSIADRAEIDAVERVHSVNHAPVLVDFVGDRTVPLGSSLSFPLSAFDSDGDSITFSTTPFPLPANMVLSFSSLEFSGDLTSSTASGSFTFTPDTSQVGEFVIAFIVSDGQGGVDSKTVTITVVGPTPGAETELTGRLLDTNDFVQGVETPVVGAIVSLMDTGISTTSSADGSFILTNVSAGSQILDIDATMANPTPDGSPYAGFREEIELIEGVNNVVQRPFFLPRIDVDSLTAVDPNTTTVVNNPNLNISLRVPPNTAMDADGTLFTGDLSVSEVPDGLAPAALPPELDPGLLITIQPVGVTFDTPIPITFPNTDNLARGSETDIWSLDPETGTFVVVGTGRVSGDGQRIETVSGGVRAADWHMALAPSPDGEDDTGDDCKACQVASGSRTAVATGNLSVDHGLVSYFSMNQPRALRLVYNSLRADPQSIIGLNTTILRRAAVPPSVSARISVGGVEQGTDVFWNTSGLSESRDETIRQAVQYDASGLQTGVYPYQVTLTSNYPQSSVSSVLSGTVVVNNHRDSFIGAGWTLDGLQRLHVQADESVLLTHGDGTSLHFSKGVLASGSVRIAESGWNLIRAVSFANGQAAHFNPIDGLLYVGRRTAPGAGGGLYRISRDGTAVKITAGDRLAGIVVDPVSGDVFYSEDFGGSIFRVALGSTDRSTWIRGVTGFHPGDDDPVGMAFAPGDYTGSVVNPGDALVVDRGFSGPDEVWRFSPDSAQGETSVHADDGTLIDAVDITIGTAEVYLVDTGNRQGGANEPGRIFRLNADGSLTLLTTSEPILDPIGIATDPITEELLVLDAAGGRLVRIDPTTGAVSEVFTGFSIPGDGWAGVDVTPDGKEIVITDDGTDSLYIFSQAPYQTPPGDYSTLIKNDNRTFTRTLKDGTKYHFNADGLQTSVVDRNGNATIYDYDADGRLTTITDPVNLETTFTYGNGRLAAITDPANRTITFEHDVAGDLKRITDPDGSSRQFLYDARHRLISQTSARNFTTRYEYDFSGRHVKSTLPDGSTRLVSPSARVGLVDTFSGLGSKDIPAPLVRPEDVIATFTDGEGRVTAFEIGHFGEATRITDPAGLVTQIDRDGDGNPIRVALPSGHVVSYVYDQHGNRVAMRDAIVNNEIIWTYDQPFNLVTSVTDPEREVTRFFYDGPNLDLLASPLGREISFTYDDRGNLTSRVDPFGVVTTLSLDTNDNIVEIRNGTVQNERSHLFELTDEGYVNMVTDPLGQVSTFDYDVLGRLTTETVPSGSAIGYSYNTEDNIVSVIPPGRPSHAFEYGMTNDLQLYRPPLIGPDPDQTRYNYNLAGQLSGIDYPGGAQLDIGYDVFGRIEIVAIPSGDFTFGFDAQNGQLKTISDPDGGNLLYEYDGELKTGMEWFGGEITGAVLAGYDPSFRVNSLTVEGTSPISYLYDADGQLASAGDLIISRDFATGLATQTVLGDVLETWDYNDFAEPDNYVAEDNGTILYETDYVYDDLARVIQMTETVQGVTHTFDYTYDPDGRLETVNQDGTQIQSYDYDENGNRTDQTGSSGSVSPLYDDQDRLLDYGPIEFTYTANGELLTKDISGVTTSYTYDSLGDLQVVNLPDGTTIEYVVDGENRRVGKKVNGQLVQGFLYKDRLNPIAELDGNNQIVSVFIYGTRPNVPDYMIRNGTTYRILSDLRGSPRLVVDIATGDVVARRDYDSFGNVQLDTDPDFLPFGFTGGLYDPDTGLTRFGARDYDAQAGRWTAKDPSLFYGGQPNLYVYAGNDPINNIDLDGSAFDTLSATCGRRPALCAIIFETGTASSGVGGAASTGATTAACLAVPTIATTAPAVVAFVIAYESRALDRSIPRVPPQSEALPVRCYFRRDLSVETGTCVYLCEDLSIRSIPNPSGDPDNCPSHFIKFPRRRHIIRPTPR